jgi:hypothetical protein
VSLTSSLPSSVSTSVSVQPTPSLGVSVVAAPHPPRPVSGAAYMGVWDGQGDLSAPTPTQLQLYGNCAHSKTLRILAPIVSAIQQVSKLATSSPTCSAAACSAANPTLNLRLDQSLTRAKLINQTKTPRSRPARSRPRPARTRLAARHRMGEIVLILRIRLSFRPWARPGLCAR